MEDDEGTVTIPVRRFAWIDLAITLLDCFSGLIDDVVQLLCSHANWKVQRRMTEEAMRADIERIVAGE